MRQLIQWLKGHIQEVPPEISLCEFQCGKPQCYQGEWEKCERRQFWASLSESVEQRPA